MNRKNLILFLFAGLAIAAIATASLFGGYLIGKYELRGFYRLSKLENPVIRKAFDLPDHDVGNIETIFLNLASESILVPVERLGDGGGLTSFNDTVLLITHEGKIFAAKSAKQLVQTSIDTPDSHFLNYKRAAQSEEYRDLTHHFHKFRYNDILYYHSSIGHGLALSYTEYNDAESCYRTAIAILPLDLGIQSVDQISAEGDDWDIIFRTQPCLPLKRRWRAIEGHMAGGRLAFKPPSTLFLASGDYHWDGIYAPEILAQNSDNHYGKVIEIDLVTNTSRIVSIGHRNTQGITFDRNGQLWVVEHGMRGGDELNMVVDGENYGWPEETLGTTYDRLPASSTTVYGRHDFYRAPVYAWLPSVGISNIVLIDGFHESWDGDLLAASLKGRSLFRIRVSDSGIQFAERIEIGERIRYVHFDNNGHLVLWTDSKHLVFLTKSDINYVTEFVTRYLARANYQTEEKHRIESGLYACLECHSFEPGVHTDSPSLASIYGAPIGRSSFVNYSKALSSKSGSWGKKELLEFLQDPQQFAPGTLMPNPGINDQFVIQEIVNILAAANTIADN